MNKFVYSVLCALLSMVTFDARKQHTLKSNSSKYQHSGRIKRISCRSQVGWTCFEMIFEWLHLTNHFTSASKLQSQMEPNCGVHRPFRSFSTRVVRRSSQRVGGRRVLVPLVSGPSRGCHNDSLPQWTETLSHF